MKIISIFIGHDGSATTFDTDTNEFKVYNFDRYFNVKHSLIAISDIELHHLIESIGIKYYDLCIFKTIERQYDSLLYSMIEDSVPAAMYLHSPLSHHDAHILSAVAQSPFVKTLCLSYDGGGDGEQYVVCIVDDLEIRSRVSYEKFIGHMFNGLGQTIKCFEGTHSLDLAGKMMGLSAYGTNNASISKLLVDKNHLFRKLIVTNGVKLDDASYCKSIQTAAENIVIQQLVDVSSPNLVITGGCALNVLINQQIRDCYPNIKTYVPPNPDDSGLSFGMLIGYLKELGYPIPRQIDLSNSGMEFSYDVDAIYEPISRTDVRKLLRLGKVIGWIEGTIEIGPRSLGRRSILADPKIKDAKDIVNKVKRRESYRPFAPVCTSSQFAKYFNGPNYNHQSMSYAVSTKAKYRDDILAVNHEDNTARVQVINDRSQFYELVQQFGRPLLNTSFNVQGKPILNRLSDALWVLDHSTMSNLIIVKDGELWNVRSRKAKM